MKRLIPILLSGCLLLPAQFHRAEQDREISYWLLDPASHQFRISHDFTIARSGQKYVHSFVRKGSVVTPDAVIFNLDTGEKLYIHHCIGLSTLQPDNVRLSCLNTQPLRCRVDNRHAIYF